MATDEPVKLNIAPVIAALKGRRDPLADPEVRAALPEKRRRLDEDIERERRRRRGEEIIDHAVMRFMVAWRRKNPWR